ncbi:hypothetical protein JHK87_025376 [Glycine soja]|nr:hypothetical protein JHK87_025376 [Glycine soja]
MLIILVHWLFYKITFLRSTDLRLLWFLRINYLSLLFAELIAIYHGIKLAWHKAYHGSTYTTHPCAAIIQAIKGFMQMDRNLIFSHTLREKNNCVDWHAKIGAHNDTSFRLWNVCPAALGPLILADALGKSATRVR